MRNKFLFLPLIWLGLGAAAQSKLLSIEEAFLQKSVTAPKNLRQLQLLYGSNDYVYLDRRGQEDLWMRGSLTSDSARPFLRLPELNARLRQAGTDTLTTMPPIQFNRGAEWIFPHPQGRAALHSVNGSFRLLATSAQLLHPIVEESSAGYVAYVEAHNLFVSDGRTARKVTADGSRDIVYASSVHRDEFGIHKGTFWSPGGRSLAFYRMDQGMVTDYPIIDWTTTPATVQLIKYPMAGNKSHQVSIGVYHTASERLVFLQTGAPAEQYLTNIPWSPDSRHLSVAQLNREQKHMRLNQYDAETGAFIKTLFEERDERYVEPLAPILFVKNNPSRFVWQSNRDGFNHLYLYDTSGRMIRQLTQGDWEVLDVKGFDEKGSAVVYLSTQLSPLSRNAWLADLQTGKTRLLTPGIAVHNVQLNETGSRLLDTYSSAEEPRAARMIDVRSGRGRRFFSAPDPLAGYARGQMRIGMLKARDGSTLYTRTFLPVGFDSTRKYPVIVYWYGGPHAQLITAGYNGGAGDYWFQYMAQRGFIVFTLDTRGSDNRGRAFEQIIHRRTGLPQLEDLQEGLAHLRGLGYADTQRMGLFGWSYGGFLTINFLLQHPGLFRAGVAGGPVTDWRMYEIMYGERYMDSPLENPEGYNVTNLNEQAGKLKDHLLLIHGLQDDVVVQQHSVRFVRSAIDKGVQVDYMPYPGHAHNVTGKDRAHLYQKVTDYFLQHLR